MELRDFLRLLTIVGIPAFSGCAHLGFGPSARESSSDLLTLPVVHRRFHEQPLQSLPSGTAAIRVTWMPEFDSPFLVRFDRRADGKVTETLKQLSGVGGYTPGYLTQNQTREVSSQRFDSLLRQLTGRAFWTAPTADPNRMESLHGPDITVEAYVQGRYHIINRYAPGDHPRENRFVQFLTDATADYTERTVLRLPWL